MRHLTRMEELVMLSIMNLKQNAYLVAIADHLSEVLEIKISITSVYLPLSRLEKKGFIKGEFGEATPVRGGRRKKIYQITKPGLGQLREYRRISDLLWNQDI